MKISNSILKVLLCGAVMAGAASCDKTDIFLGAADTGHLMSPDGNVVYVTDGNGNSDVGYLEFNGTGSLDLFLRSSKTLSQNVSATFAYDLNVLKTYNEGQNTEVAAFPEGKVTLSGDGKVSIEAGKLSSGAMTVTLSADAALDPDVTYAVPLSVTPEGASLNSGAYGYVILVRDISKFPGTEKFYNGKPGMKIIGVFEVNDVNPLNVLGFTLKGSGKQFFDMVVLFSANINYNAQTGRVYISRNDNVQALLDNRAKYLKPLQERGIKVILGILGNHDISGISTLDPTLAKEFAKEVKQVCDAYELDGVMLDDEYTDYNAAASGTIPGFIPQSVEAASRMAYEIRQAQPARLILSYRYGALSSAVDINGMQPGQFFDYVLNDYWVTSNPVSTYPGLRQDQAGTGSWNCSGDSQCIPSNSNWKGRFSLTGMREAGYGALMIFNFTCNPDYWMTPYIVKDMETTANDFWGEELQYDQSWYPKDF